MYSHHNIQSDKDKTKLFIERYNLPHFGTQPKYNLEHELEGKQPSFIDDNNKAVAISWKQYREFWRLPPGKRVKTNLEWQAHKDAGSSTIMGFNGEIYIHGLDIDKKNFKGEKLESYIAGILDKYPVLKQCHRFSTMNGGLRILFATKEPIKGFGAHSQFSFNEGGKFCGELLTGDLELGGHTLLPGALNYHWQHFPDEIVIIEEPLKIFHKYESSDYWDYFNSFQFRKDQLIPLEKCISQTNRKNFLSGVEDNRNNEMFRVGIDLFGCAEELDKFGQAHNDPLELYDLFVSRCGASDHPLTQKEIDDTWDSINTHEGGKEYKSSKDLDVLKGDVVRHFYVVDGNNRKDIPPSAYSEKVADINGGLPTGDLQEDLEKLSVSELSGVELENQLIKLSSIHRVRLDDVKKLYEDILDKRDKKLNKDEINKELDKRLNFIDRDIAIDKYDIPDEFKSALRQQTIQHGCNYTVLLSSLMTMFGGLIRTDTSLKIFKEENSNFKVLGNMFTLIMGEPSDGKSAVLNIFADPIKDIQEDVNDARDREAELKEIENAKLKRAGKEIDDEEVPEARIFWDNDITIEKQEETIVKQKNLPFLIIQDELSGFLSKLDKAKNTGRGNSELAKWLSIRDNGGISTSRVSRGKISCRKTSVSVIGTIQNDTFKEFMQDNSVNNGFLERFIVSPHHGLRKTSPDKMGEEIININKILKNCYLSEIKYNQGLKHKFSPDAQDRYEEWYDYTEDFRENNKHDPTKAFLTKGQGVVGKYALILHRLFAALKGEVPAVEVSLNTLEAALDLFHMHWDTVKNVYSDIWDNDISNRTHLEILDLTSNGEWYSERSIQQSRYFKKNRIKSDKIRELFKELADLGRGEIRKSLKTKGKIDFRIIKPKPPKSEAPKPTPSPEPKKPDPTPPPAVLEPLPAPPKPKVEVVEDSRKVEACEVKNGQLLVDLDKLDLDRKPQATIDDWQPTKTIKDYKDVEKLYFDIETTGLDPDECRVISIGLQSHIGDKTENTIIDGEDEFQMLLEFISYLSTSQAEIIIGHNVHQFDLPFVAKRCDIHKIDHPFSVERTNDNLETILEITGAIKVFGKFITIKPYLVEGMQVIDTYIQSAIFDKAAAKLPNLRLKDVAIAMGVRKERRLELTNTQIQECWAKRDMKTINEYMVYDLDDTKGIADYLVPVIWYQQLLVPNTDLQHIAKMSTARRWDRVIKYFYSIDYLKTINAYQKIYYEGGESGSKHVVKGMHNNVFKIDVSSMYPSIMLHYELTSDKDVDNRMLSVLRYLFAERFKLKKLFKETGDPAYDQQQGALKIMLNCFTGDTLVTTSEGDKRMDELLDKPCEVINGNGDWSKVQFKKYGRNGIWEVKVRKRQQTQTIRCTKNHRWLSVSKSRLTEGNSPNKKPRKENIFNKTVITSELRVGDILPHVRSAKPSVDNESYKAGLIHGIVYGDGTHNNYKYCKNRYTVAIGKKKIELEPYFRQSSQVRHIGTNGSKREDIEMRISIESNIGNNLKEVPPENSDKSYILGFIRGLISTDGNVGKNDGYTTISGNLKVCEWIKYWGVTVGYNFNRITLNHKAGRKCSFTHRTFNEDINDYVKTTYTTTSKIDNYHLKFDVGSVSEDDLLRSFHRENYLNYIDSRKYATSGVWFIESVKELNVYEDIYCCEEPITESFVLEKGILTRNSSYGYMGVGGYKFNDMRSAALVTGYGRKILKLMSDRLSELNATILEVDTDGIICKGGDHSPKEMCDKVIEVMPESIGLDLDYEGVDIYLHGSKNYIIFDGDKVKKVGIFRKRDQIPFINEFRMKFIDKLRTSQESALNYYSEVISSIEKRTIDIESIKVTRNIPKSAKKLIELGIGKPGEKVTYYFGEEVRIGKRGQPLKSVKKPVVDGEYWIDYYLDELEKAYTEISKNVGII